MRSGRLALADRRELLTDIFEQLTRPGNCLVYLMSLKRDPSLSNYLRHLRLYQL